MSAGEAASGDAEPAPDVSVVAVSWNTAQCLPDAIDSVLDGAATVRAEVIVVDNGSRDESVAVLSARRDVDLVSLDGNTGFTHAANVGSARARGRYVLFLNPDIVAPAGVLDTLVEVLDRHPEAWGATPLFQNPDGSVQRFWRRRLRAVTFGLCFTHRGRKVDRVLGGRARRRLEYGDRDLGQAVSEIESVGAAFLLVRRSDFEAAGRFDERFFNFFQDTALQRQMDRAGRRLLGVGTIAVTHQLGVTFRELPPATVHGQLLYAARQYFATEPWPQRLIVWAAVRLEVAGAGGQRADLRRLALAPLEAR